MSFDDPLRSHRLLRETRYDAAIGPEHQRNDSGRQLADDIRSTTPFRAAKRLESSVALAQWESW
jgi:hypothetical protein